MTEWNAFKGAAGRIDDIDIPRIGHKIGVGEDELHAFMDVEAAGSGFDSKGRPKMLFEPHVFYRNLTGAKRKKAVDAGLAYPKWKSGGYPKDSYPRLVKAMAIDETAALKAASWGLGQILGENHTMIGYATPQAMVRAFMDDEENHLEAIVDFLIASGIDDDLKAHNWEVVARVYNGPGYKKHNYHGRMAKAFAKWAKIPDTPWSPPGKATLPPARVPEGEPEIIEEPAEPVESLDLKKGVAERAQELLKEKGWYADGLVDDDAGGRTQAAILAFRNENGLPLKNSIDAEFMAALEAAPPRYIPPERAEMTVATMMAKDTTVAEPLRQNWWQKLVAWVVAIPSVLAAAFSGIMDFFGEATSKLDPLKAILSDVPVWVWFGLAAGVALTIWLGARRSDNNLADMTRTGKVA